MATSIKTFWWRQVKITGVTPNFGDELTPGLVGTLFGQKCSWRRAKRCDMIGAGSTLEMVQLMQARKGLKVWGSGFMLSDAAHERDFSYPDFDFYAVRGHLSLGRIKSEREVAVGDPGLLANKVYARSPRVPGRIGLVYHWVHKKDPVVRSLARDKSVTLIDPSRKPAKVIADITACDFVMSTSLHGLIVADSYGIPNAWIKLPQDIGGNGYKFADYYSAFDRQAVQHSSDLARDHDRIAQLQHEYRPVPNLKKIQDKLIGAFPFAPPHTA